MLTFSQDPNVAEQQMTALIFYLTAFGYVDGNFDFTEKTFVRFYIRQLVTARAHALMPSDTAEQRASAGEVIERFVAHFHELFEQIDRHVRELFSERNPQDRHGRTSHLSPTDLDDLATYVLSL